MEGAGKGLGNSHKTHEEAGILTPGKGKAVGQSHGFEASTISVVFIIHHPKHTEAASSCNSVSRKIFFALQVNLYLNLTGQVYALGCFSFCLD